MSANDGRWLIFGYPPNPKYSQSHLDERQVEDTYAAHAIKAYCQMTSGLLLHALECGAASSPDACKLADFWKPFRIEWNAIDNRPVTSVLYNERIESPIGKAELADFDLILAVSTLEHSAWVGDTVAGALVSLRKGLGLDGILILTWPIGKPHDYKDFHQFSVEESREVIAAARLQIIHERLWRWNGTYFENCLEEDVAGTSYGFTNKAPRAAGVGAWVLCR